jgi:DNA-directed RNA polymerase II subunit RPB1
VGWGGWAETVKGIIDKARKGQLDPEPGMTLRETFEAMINKALNETRNESGKKAMESLKVRVRVCSGGALAWH